MGTLLPSDELGSECLGHNHRYLLIRKLSGSRLFFQNVKIALKSLDKETQYPTPWHHWIENGLSFPTIYGLAMLSLCLHYQKWVLRSIDLQWIKHQMTIFSRVEFLQSYIQKPRRFYVDRHFPLIHYLQKQCRSKSTKERFELTIVLAGAYVIPTVGTYVILWLADPFIFCQTVWQKDGGLRDSIELTLRSSDSIRFTALPPGLSGWLARVWIRTSSSNGGVFCPLNYAGLCT